ncbi:MAG: lamin tail domain-containing protein, partial [Chloroflexota bacterium]
MEANPDWIELVNTGSSPATLDGWTLTDHSDQPFVFPAGTVLPPNGFLVVACDGLTNAAGLHAPFKLDHDGETIGLYDKTQQRIDVLTFGHQAADYSVGRAGAGGVWQLTQPTRGTANQSAEFAAASGLKINEWLANGRPGEDDWLELYNPD